MLSGIPGVFVYLSEMTSELDGKRIYVAHGDLVNRKDYSYLVLRAFFRSWIMKFLVLLVPGRFLDWIGTKSSSQSRAKKPLLVTDFSVTRREYLRRIYRSYAAEKLSQGFDFVVMGHCHDLDEMSFNIGGRSAQYINVGYPRMHGSFVSWMPGDEKMQRERLPLI